MGRVNVETSKAVGGKSKVSDRMKYQEGNGFLNDRRLESFGYLLDDYVLNGAELSVDSVDIKKIHVSEGIISFQDQLWRAFASEFLVYKPGVIHYLGYLIDTGYVFGITEPLENYIRLWSVETDINGFPGTMIDYRGELNRVKFKAIYDGVYLNTEEVEAAVASVTGAVADAQTAVETAKLAVADAEQAVVNTGTAIINAQNATQGAISATEATILVKESAELVTQETITVKNAAILATEQSEATRLAMQNIVSNLKSASEFVLTKAYKQLNVVRKNGSSYLAKVDTQNNPLPILPVEENEWWMLLAQRGIDGTGSVAKVDGASPNVDGEVISHLNKEVLDAFSDVDGNVKYNGVDIGGAVKSVNGATGEITGLETVVGAEEKDAQVLIDAKTYTNQEIAKIEVSGGLKSATFDYELTATTDAQTDFVIPLETFNHLNDGVFVVQNTTFLSPISRYSIVEPNIIRLVNGVTPGTKLFVMVTKDVPVGADGSVDGLVIAINSLPMDRVIGLQEALNNAGSFSGSYTDLTNIPTSFPSTIPTVTGLQDALDLKFTVAEGGTLTDLTTTTKLNLVAAINEINAKPTGGDTTEIAKQINTLYNLSTSLMRSDALRTLREEAEGILEDNRGTIFAHDMNGNIIGMTLDEANSQNIVIRDGKMLMINKSDVTKTVTDSTVVASAYDTSGNGGRKLVRLSNGWLVAATNLGSIGGGGITVYVSKDNGSTWVSNVGIGINVGSVVTDFALVPFGNKVQIFVTSDGYKSAVSYTLDVILNTKSSEQRLDHINQTAVGNCSLTINPEGTELHAAWSSKNSTYPSSFNIRYAKGVISQVDGSVTWGAVEQRSSYNTSGQNAQNPTIVFQNDYPLIVFDYVSSGNYSIGYFRQSISGWNTSTLYNGGTYAQSNPSAIFVPKSVNGLANGRIWVSWFGNNTTNVNYYSLYVGFSDDGGINWHVQILLQGDENGAGMRPSITASSKNKVSIIFDYNTIGGVKNIGIISYENDNWGNVVSKVYTTTQYPNTSSLVDLSLDFSEPLFIYKQTSKVGFYGTWKEPIETPTLTAKAVYDIPSTDFVGAFVQKINSDLLNVLSVKAYVNDVEVVAAGTSTNVEVKFTKQLDSASLVKLRLELSRAATTGGENDAITKIVGGRA